VAILPPRARELLRARLQLAHLLLLVRCVQQPLPRLCSLSRALLLLLLASRLLCFTPLA